MASRPRDLRRPPTRAILSQHPQGVRGICGWCGGVVTEKTEVRGWLRYWHDACEFERQIIEQPDVARRAVFDRDHGVCADCGEDHSESVRWVPAYGFETSTGERLGVTSLWHWVDLKSHRSLAKCDHGAWAYTEIRSISLWHVDHKVPLWKVAHLPDLQRIEFFKLANLVTLCERCHKRKSARETAERHHLDRLVEPEVKGRSRWPKRKQKWPSRPMRSG